MPLRAAVTTYGTVEGVACGNPIYTVYKGIPYAAPTNGKNRFLPPKSPESWEGKRLCDKFSPICMQEMPDQKKRSGMFSIKEFYPYRYKCGEDSLCLNIWTPAQDPDERLPVMVWIHGGGFGSGYGHEMEFDGEAFCKEGIILVTLNYRLNFFGFFAHPQLSTEDPRGVSGNYGILDQIAALRWIQENIQNFGGDKKNVTIFGQSAGGGSVIAHLISDLSDGLFSKAIIQSGTFTMFSDVMMETLEEGESWGVRACEYLGKSVDDMRSMSLSDAYTSFVKAEKKIGPAPKLLLDGYVFKERPLDALKRGRWKNVPMIVGSVKGDKSLSEKLDDTLKDAGIYLPQTSFTGDIFIGMGQRKKGRIPAFIYYFDPEIPGHDIYHFIEDGLAYHSSELWYIFGTLNRCWRNFSGQHYELSKKMIKYWTNFAKTGNPNGNMKMTLDLPYWPAFTYESSKKINFNEKNIKMIEMGELENFSKFFEV